MMARCDDLITAAMTKISDDWGCVPLEDGRLLVTTSHQYSDGDHVELLVRGHDESVEVSDGGEALARLDLAGVSVDHGRARDMWFRLLRAHELETHNEQLVIHGSIDDAGRLVENMANAVANIDGIRLLAPPSRSPQFAERVVTFFQAEFENVEENPQLHGRSGGLYRATAAVGDPENATYVQAVAGASVRTRQRPLEHAFTMFSDVNGTLSVTRKLVVLSDADWKSEQTRLLSTVTYVGSWSYRDNLVDFISASHRPSSRILMPAQGSLVEGAD